MADQEIRSYVVEDGGLPYRAEADGVFAAALTPEAAVEMVQKILATRQPSE
jgi:hypothetical protein